MPGRVNKNRACILHVGGKQALLFMRLALCRWPISVSLHRSLFLFCTSDKTMGTWSTPYLQRLLFLSSFCTMDSISTMIVARLFFFPYSYHASQIISFSTLFWCSDILRQHSTLFYIRQKAPACTQHTYRQRPRGEKDAVLFKEQFPNRTAYSVRVRNWILR